MKLKTSEAAAYVQAATLAKCESKGVLRFGQALFNLLPLEVTNLVVGTEHDFFYTKDVSEVLKKFGYNCVEND